MQGRARGRKGERKTYDINPYHHITMEFGGYLLNVAKKTTRARPRKGEAQGVLSYQKATGIFDNPHIYISKFIQKEFERKGASCVKTLAYAVSMQLAVLSEMAKEIVFWLKILS